VFFPRAQSVGRGCGHSNIIREVRMALHAPSKALIIVQYCLY
jgi:hypothetical protein